MGRFKRLLLGGIGLESGLSGMEYRQYLVGVYVYPFGLITHALLFGLFLHLGLLPMALFNIGSMALFAGCFFLNRKKRFILAFYLGYLEVIIHAWAATLCTSWAAGFHFFIFVAGAGATFIIFGARRGRWFALAIAAAAYGALALLTRNRVLPAGLDADTLLYSNIAIIVGTFIALGFMGNYQNQAAEETERMLQEERNRLHRANDAIRQELQLARDIQLQHIPAASPFPWISFYYKPMHLLGGDFFDFFVFPSGKLGIFLSDVSGHGVPAALVTSIIKSYSLQHALTLESPAAFLAGLNTFLQNRTGDNFVTAFYGILDREEASLVFSNAGHNPPYLLAGDAIRRLTATRKSPPLNVLANPELEKIGKEYCDETVRLAKDSRILLYTDGLTEAIPMAGSSRTAHIPDFESERLDAVLKSCCTDCPSALIDSLVSSLISWRGEDHFEDDVCLICIGV